MKAKIYRDWDRVRSSFWFIPSLLVGGVIIVAFAAVAIDEAISEEWAQGWIYSGGAEGARTILGTIAGSMITTAGVVFSITLVALTLASSQLGPRLLRNFRRDTTTQVVIGSLVATFMYCLLVLRSIRGENTGSFVPNLSVSLGVLFALVSLGVLIYFIHHIALSIQADEVVARVAEELTQGINRLFPEKIGEGVPRHAAERPNAIPESFDREACPICALEDGYLQLIDPDALLNLAVKEDVLLRLEQRPGSYIIAGGPLVWVWPAGGLTERMEASIRDEFTLGTYRTPIQDVEFSINQLVEVAVRALSPGINDPFTAITCVDRLGSALCRLSQREMPSPYRRDEQGRLRVVAPTVTFRGVADAALNPIRQSARSSATVTIRLLETITLIAGFARRPDDRASLWRQVEMIARGAHEGLPEKEDREAVERRYREAGRMLR